MRASAFLPIIAVLSLISCDSNTPVDIFDISGGVAGIVRTSSGAPVAGAVVTATAAYPLVGSTMPITDSAQTSAGGEYAIRFTTLNLPDAEAPVSLHVRPPAGSGFLGLDTSGFTVPIARSSPNSVHVDIALTPSQSDAR